MSIDNIISIIISILGSSVVTLILSTFILHQSKRNKIYFDEKKRAYDSIVVFAQIVLYPKEAKYSLGVTRYNIQELSDKENVNNALNDLKMAIPKIRLITRDDIVIESIEVLY